MQRSIKFRFFYKNKRIEDNLTLREIADRCSFHWHDAVIVVQFTGLLDKNGTEICEGDIVTNEHNMKMEVFYHQSEDRAEWAGRLHTFSTGGYILGWFAANLSEIIGNIYENPELLDGKR